MDSPNAEFRRQLRSLFAVLRAIVRRSADGEGSRADYAAMLEGRIGALARVHDMLMRAPDDGIDLAELVHGEILAQTIPAARYRASGAETRIGRDAAMPIALALHELTVNCLIHGAFAIPSGALEIHWAHVDRAGGKWLQVRWQESGMHLSGNAPTTKGFGLELLERTLPYELGAHTQIDWPQSGARIELMVPAQPNAAFWRPAQRAIAV